MAGHSKWANIKHRKGAQDKKRSNIFTKVGREIIVAAKMGGSDQEYNPRLRVAVAAAKAVNMPKDKIDYAIKKGAGELDDGETYEEIRYEGYGPGGVAVIIEVLTDNRNRSASDIRSILNKAGGSLGESGSVSFQFERVGIMQYPVSTASADDMFEAALEAGADNCESDDNMHEITCNPDDFNEARDVLVKRFGDPETCRLDWKPNNTIEVNLETAQKIMKLIDTLEENDDVQNVSANFDIPDEVAEQL